MYFSWWMAFWAIAGAFGTAAMHQHTGRDPRTGGLIGLVVGFALGRAKFIGSEGHQTRVLALGLGAAIGLSGLFTMIESVATRHGLDYRPVLGLASAAVFAVLVFVLLSVLVDRHLASSPHARRVVPLPPTTEHHQP